MKNNTRKTNSYTQGHQLTARVLLILWLFGSCGLGSTLAAPKSHDQHVQTSPRSSSLPPGTVSENISGSGPAPKKDEDLTALINTIENNESWICRQAAVKAIGQLFAGFPDNKRAIALQALISAAKDLYIDSYEVAIETLQQSSTNFNADERKTVLQELEGLITDAERSALHVRLAFNGILEICQEQPNDSYDFLAKATKSQYPHVRQPAFETIGKLLARLPDNKRAIALQALIDASKAQESNVRQAVVWAFGQNLDSLKGDDHSKAFQALIDANADQESNVRQAAVWAFGQNLKSLKGDDHIKAFQALIDANADQESNVRQAAVWALGKNLKSLEGDDHSKAFQALIDANADQESNVRQAAVWVLGQNLKSLEGDDHIKALEALIDASEAQDSNVRQAAVWALNNLAEYLNDKLQKVLHTLRVASSNKHMPN